MGREQTKLCFLGPYQLRATCSLNEVHEIPRRFTICIGLKHDIQIGSRSECIQEGPKCEALTTVFGQPEIDFHVLDAGIESFRRDCCQVRNAEVAADLLIEIHRVPLDPGAKGQKVARSALSSTTDPQAMGLGGPKC